MCCFLVPMAEAIATTIIRKTSPKAAESHIGDLEKMLWGGTLMLVVDHIINGELMWAFPFFTALAKEGGSILFLKELLFVGAPMALALTAAWGIWVFFKRRHSVATY